MVKTYPEDIRAWIESKGGYTKLSMEGNWALTASDLWKMAYRKCAD